MKNFFKLMSVALVVAMGAVMTSCSSSNGDSNVYLCSILQTERITGIKNPTCSNGRDGNRKIEYAFRNKR